MTFMKLGILSDIHANSIALSEVIKDLKSLNIKQMIFLGDLVINGPSPKEVFNQLKKLKPVIWIKGNTDEWFLEINEQWEPKSINEIKFYELFHFSKERLYKQDIEFIKKLPFSESIELNSVKVLCVHGSPRNIAESMSPEIPDHQIIDMIDGIEEKVILCGHFHSSTNREVNDKLILNPGSIGNPMDEDPRASYGILEIRDNGEIEFLIRRIPYDINENLRIAKLRKFPYLDEYERKLRYATSRID